MGDTKSPRTAAVTRLSRTQLVAGPSGRAIPTPAIGLLVVATLLLVVATLLLGALVVRPRPAAGALPAIVGGLKVYSVAAVLAARAAGELQGSDKAVAVGGFWSVGPLAHLCGAPTGRVGELELSCHDGEFGITDEQEQIFAVDPSGHATYAAGPHLTPYVSGSDPDSQQLFGLPVVNGQPFPPVPIVVVGHFDDPRAAECGEAALKRCEDRFILDSVAIFDPTMVATPAPTLSPTAFPDAAPSGLFDPSAPEVCAGDVAYAFIGWTTTSALKVGFERPGHVWAAVTKDPVLLGGPAWNRETEGGGPAFRWWGRRVCLATEAEPDVILYDAIPGTTYKEWEDGTITHADLP